MKTKTETVDEMVVRIRELIMGATEASGLTESQAETIRRAVGPLLEGQGVTPVREALAVLCAGHIDSFELGARSVIEAAIALGASRALTEVVEQTLRELRVQWEASPPLPTSKGDC